MKADEAAELLVLYFFIYMDVKTVIQGEVRYCRR